MHRLMDESCSNCNKFSHCNNNDLICVSKYKAKEQECEELKFTIKHTGLLDLMNENVELRNTFNEILKFSKHIIIMAFQKYHKVKWN